jgi:hypothetical protein
MRHTHIPARVRAHIDDGERAGACTATRASGSAAPPSTMWSTGCCKSMAAMPTSPRCARMPPPPPHPDTPCLTLYVSIALASGRGRGGGAAPAQCGRVRVHLDGRPPVAQEPPPAARRLSLLRHRPESQLCGAPRRCTHTHTHTHIHTYTYIYIGTYVWTWAHERLTAAYGAFVVRTTGRRLGRPAARAQTTTTAPGRPPSPKYAQTPTLSRSVCVCVWGGYVAAWSDAIRAAWAGGGVAGFFRGGRPRRRRHRFSF